LKIRAARREGAQELVSSTGDTGRLPASRASVGDNPEGDVRGVDVCFVGMLVEERLVHEQPIKESELGYG